MNDSLEERIAKVVRRAVAEKLESAAPQIGEVDVTADLTWRERLWVVPAQTRLSTEEVAEALGRGTSFVYKRTQSDAENPIPHRKLSGGLVFTAGELRAWIEANEEAVVGGPMLSTLAEKRDEAA